MIDVIRQSMNEPLLDGPDVEHARSLDLSRTPLRELRRRLKEARRQFEAAGGRGVDLAEIIDNARFELRSRASKRGWRNRRRAQHTMNTGKSIGTVDAQSRPLSFAHWLSETCRHGAARRHCNYCLTDALSTVSMDLTFARFVEIVEPQS